MTFKILKEIISTIKTDIEKISEIDESEKKDIIKKLIIQAILMYGKSKLEG